ncbi:MAG: glycoside hydrolase family 97 protein [Prevotella sp.]|nr:glycoside hydrolase family 97 protein [Prevotella sp.]
MKQIILTILLALSCVCSHATEYTLASPNGRLVAIVENIGDLGLMLSVRMDGVAIVAPSQIGLTLADGTDIGRDVKMGAVKRSVIVDDTDAPFYRQRHIKTTCNQIDIRLKGGFGLQVRAFDEGVAYRFYTTRKGETIIKNERADYDFTGDPKVWLAYSTNKEKPFAMAFQNTYDETLLSQAQDTPAFLPATVQKDGCSSAKVTILESDLRNYPGMFLRSQGAPNSQKRLSAVFAPYPKRMEYYKWRGMSYVSEAEEYIAKSKGPRTYPWRIFAISEEDTAMPVNDLVYTLAAPNEIGPTDWIKPGKVAWDWWNDWNLRGVDFKAGINTRTYQYYIDFAARFGLQYIVLDEGWYESAKGDIMNAIPDIDLPELIAYGKERGIGIVLWTVFNVLDEHLEEACRKYADMGVKGFKVDFLDRNDQTAVEMAERIARHCAGYKLFLDYHGFYSPTGLSRTYPNVLNYEGVFGMEECRWAKKETDMPRYDVTFPFMRQMAGQTDFTPGAMRNGTRSNWVECYEKPVSMGTRCHQAACYVLHDSPFTMLCDAPTSYEQEPDYTKFIAEIPVVWDETRVLQGEMGKYIVIARRKGDTWYVGGQTDWDARAIELPLSFLDDGAYTATLLTDGINANHNAEDHLFDHQFHNSSSTLTINMASGGGFVLKLDKLNIVDHL